jgi:hypothetical protein
MAAAHEAALDMSAAARVTTPGYNRGPFLHGARAVVSP